MPIQSLHKAIAQAKGSPIMVICRSSRTASLVKLTLVDISPSKSILGVEVLSFDKYISDMAR